MRKNLLHILILILASSFLLSSCKSTRYEDNDEFLDEFIEDNVDYVDEFNEEDLEYVEEDFEPEFIETVEKEVASIMPIDIVYFDFNRYNIRSDARFAIRNHLDFIKSQPSITILLEGHADERGTWNYNMALGAKRANAVKQYLMSYGVSESQIEVVSMGEEFPARPGIGEHVWKFNRRVIFKYGNIKN